MHPFLFSFLALLLPLQLTTSSAPALDNPPRIQVALLLDTSNSMDGLIEQAKTQLWQMVNDLATTRKDGQAPRIELALYEYGNDRLSSQDDYIRQVTSLTDDLDKVSDLLFQLTTYGGLEYCGAVIQRAVVDLEWSASNEDLKLIVIAGNEPFTQGPVDFRKACKEAIAKGIQINTIHCGSHEEGVRGFWKEGADLADGRYFNIDQNRKISYVPTPYDDRILELNRRLNGTYIGYGQLGAQNVERQRKQDANAMTLSPSAAAERATYKAKSQYQNASWDLVDASNEEDFSMAEIEEAALPAEMAGMSVEEREAYVKQKAEERSAIQAEILELERQARAFRTQAEAEAAASEEGPMTLDKVMRKATREQAAAKAFDVD